MSEALLQEILAYSLIALALAYVVWRGARLLRSEGGCGGGCGCSSDRSDGGKVEAADRIPLDALMARWPKPSDSRSEPQQLAEEPASD